MPRWPAGAPTETVVAATIIAQRNAAAAHPGRNRLLAMVLIFINDFAETRGNMELSSKRLVIGAALLALASAPGIARAQYGGGGMASGSAQQEMLSNIMHAGPDSVHRQDNKSPDQVVTEAKKGLADADPRVRAESLDKLRDLNDPKAHDLLMQGLVDPDIRVRIRAIDILGADQFPAAVPLMDQQLFLRDTPAIVKLHIVAALGRIGDSRGTLPVVEFLKEASDDASRGTAVFALGEIGDPRANDALIQTLTHDKSDMVRKLAQESLEKIDGELPTAHTAQLTAERDKQMIPTDQRLSKMREVDQELHKLGD
jgi:HEAT repeats